MRIKCVTYEGLELDANVLARVPYSFNANTWLGHPPKTLFCTLVNGYKRQDGLWELNVYVDDGDKYAEDCFNLEEWPE